MTTRNPTRMPNARLAQQEPRPPIDNKLPPNTYPVGQILRLHEVRLVAVEKQLKKAGNDNSADSGLTLEVLNEKLNRLAELVEALSSKLADLSSSSSGSEDENGEEEDGDNEEGVTLEVSEN